MSKYDKIPSPCIDICKDIRDVCVGCGRTKKEQKAWKRADSDKERLALLRDCLETTERMGVQAMWLREYRRKCIKKGAERVLKELDALKVE